MAKPFAPVVTGPITTISTQVYVDNILPNAAVTVYNDAASSHAVGTAMSTVAGGTWVNVAGIALHNPITARQEYKGSDPTIKVTGESDPSSPVPVQAIPNPLPSPVFVSGLCTCMDSILMDGLIPGAILTIKNGATTVASALVTQTPQWFSVTGPAIAMNATLTAHQVSGANVSPVVMSLPVVVAGPLTLPAITPPLLACQTSLEVSNLTPGADLKIVNGGTDSYATSPWDSYTLTGVPPLKPGPLTAQQYFTRCQREPAPTATFTVVKAAPNFPTVGYTPCTNVTQLMVSNLLAGEVLSVSVSYSTTGGPVLTYLGAQGVSGGNATVNLPSNWYPTSAVGAVTLQIAVQLCDTKLPLPGYTAVAVGQPPGAYAAPSLPPTLFDCARSVQVLGAHPGSVVQVFSDPGAVPLSNAVVATTADFAIRLWAPLLTNEVVYVTEIGCQASKKSASVTVDAVPRQLTPPAITLPVYAGTPTIGLSGIYPGAMVYLSVNGTLRTHAEVDEATTSLPAGSPALKVGDKLSVVQAICSAVSGAGAATVTAMPVKPLAPIILLPKNGAAFVSPTTYLQFEDPGSGTPAAATEALFLVSQGGVIVGPYISASMTSPPFSVGPGYKWGVPLPSGVCEFSVWFKNAAGTGPETDSYFTVGGAALTPTLTVVTPLGGGKFEVEGGGFQGSATITIFVNPVLGTVKPATFTTFSSSGGDINQEIDTTAICSEVGGGQLQVWAGNPSPSTEISNVILIMCGA